MDASEKLMNSKPLSDRIEEFRRTTLAIIVVFLTFLLEGVLYATFISLSPELIMDSLQPELRLLMDENKTVNEMNNFTMDNLDGLDIISDSTTKQFKSVLMETGILTGIKHAVSFILSPIFGLTVETYGNRIPLLTGSALYTISVFVFAFSDSYGLFIFARIIHGIAASLNKVAGLALLTDIFLNDIDRSRVSSLCTSGYGLGMIVGFLESNFLFQYCGKAVPFALAGSISAIDFIGRYFIIEPPKREVFMNGANTELDEYENVDDHMKDSQPGGKLDKFKKMMYMLLDVYLLVGLGNVLFTVTPKTLTDATRVPYMLKYMKAEHWQIGVLFLVPTVCMLIVQFKADFLIDILTDWIMCMAGVAFLAVGMIIFPFCKSLWLFIIPEVGISVGTGIIVTVSVPVLAKIGDRRFGGKRPYVYGFYSMIWSMSNFLGPILGGLLTQLTDFTALYCVTGGLCLVYSMSNIKLKNIVSK